MNAMSEIVRLAVKVLETKNPVKVPDELAVRLQTENRMRISDKVAAMRRCEGEAWAIFDEMTLS